MSLRFESLRPVVGRLALLLFLCLVYACATDAPADGAIVVLVRHAEKATVRDDPPLTEAGLTRAHQLADLLQDTGINAVYSTNFRRTRDTAEPLASRQGLQTQIYDWNELQALADDLKRPGRRSLVVGHSDTTTELVGLLGGEPGPPIDERGEYDRLYLVQADATGAVSTVLLRYGAPFRADQSE